MSRKRACLIFIAYPCKIMPCSLATSFRVTIPFRLNWPLNIVVCPCQAQSMQGQFILATPKFTPHQLFKNNQTEKFALCGKRVFHAFLVITISHRFKTKESGQIPHAEKNFIVWKKNRLGLKMVYFTLIEKLKYTYLICCTQYFEFE